MTPQVQLLTEMRDLLRDLLEEARKPIDYAAVQQSVRESILLARAVPRGTDVPQ